MILGKKNSIWIKANMSSIFSEIPKLDRTGLRRFGFSTGAIIAVLFGLALPWLFGFNFPVWPWVVAAVLIVWGALAPSSLAPVYTTWMKLGLLLNKVVSPVVLGIVFFAVVTPIGAVMRLFGQDPLKRDESDISGSYRTNAEIRDPKHFERPY